MKKSLILFCFLIFSAVHSFACTSVIISGRVTESGKPLMLKNRDTDELNNRIEYFKGPIYSFVGLVNSSSLNKEVWAGTNSKGFCIMNTASYNLGGNSDDNLLKDQEGKLMFMALGTCATVDDFESFLNIRPKPNGVSANFGVIDAKGGAAYFEVNNYSYKKYDVNEIPCGYRVVTNFSESGSFEGYRGYERYLTAMDIMSGYESQAENGKMYVGPFDLFYDFSRSYRNSMVGIDYLNNYYSLKKDFGFTGIVIDQDFIPRRSTSASIVFEGVKEGEDPLHTIMWSILGYPSCSVPVPVVVVDTDIVPSFLKSSQNSMNSEMCDKALKIKDTYLFYDEISNGEMYLDLNNVIKLQHSCLITESFLEGEWQKIYNSWVSGQTSLQVFKMDYYEFTRKYYDKYLKEFSSFIQ